MSDSNVPEKNKLLVVLVAVLIAAVAVQGYFLFQMHRKVSADTIRVTAERNDDSNLTPQGEKGKGAPPTGLFTPQDPFGNFFNTPFDPNSWNPFNDIEAMRKQMDQMFDQTFQHFNSSPQFNNLSSGMSFNPKLDIEENDQEYIVRMDIPGADSSKINATIEDRTLTISGVREEEVSGQEPNRQLREERRLGQFERVMTLPGPVKQSGMKANYKDGVLTVVIQKDPSAPQSNKIPIQ